jgi:hypothetical protein
MTNLGARIKNAPPNQCQWGGADERAGAPGVNKGATILDSGGIKLHILDRCVELSA